MASTKGIHVFCEFPFHIKSEERTQIIQDCFQVAAMETEGKKKSHTSTYYDLFLKSAVLIAVVLAASSFVIATLSYVNVRDLETRINSLTEIPSEDDRVKRSNAGPSSGKYYYKGKSTLVECYAFMLSRPFSTFPSILPCLPQYLVLELVLIM